MFLTVDPLRSEASWSSIGIISAFTLSVIITFWSVVFTHFKNLSVIGFLYHCVRCSGFKWPHGGDTPHRCSCTVKGIPLIWVGWCLCSWWANSRRGDRPLSRSCSWGEQVASQQKRRSITRRSVTMTRRGHCNEISQQIHSLSPRCFLSTSSSLHTWRSVICLPLLSSLHPALSFLSLPSLLSASQASQAVWWPLFVVLHVQPNPYLLLCSFLSPLSPILVVPQIKTKLKRFPDPSHPFFSFSSFSPPPSSLLPSPVVSYCLTHAALPLSPSSRERGTVKMAKYEISFALNFGLPHHCVSFIV